MVFSYWRRCRPRMILGRAISDGGWLRWVNRPDRGEEVRSAFVNHAQRMLSDLDISEPTKSPKPVYAELGDARSLPLDSNSADAILTSPPYPNRHDYSRVFHIGLLLLGTTEDCVKQLRYRSLRSHVEAKPPDGYNGRLTDYVLPKTVDDVLRSLPDKIDSRIPSYDPRIF